jgi:hypothetical protein
MAAGRQSSGVGCRTQRAACHFDSRKPVCHRSPIQHSARYAMSEASAASSIRHGSRAAPCATPRLARQRCSASAQRRPWVCAAQRRLRSLPPAVQRRPQQQGCRRPASRLPPLAAAQQGGGSGGAGGSGEGLLTFEEVQQIAQSRYESFQGSSGNDAGVLSKSALPPQRT